MNAVAVDGVLAIVALGLLALVGLAVIIAHGGFGRDRDVPDDR